LRAGTRAARPAAASRHSGLTAESVELRIAEQLSTADGKNRAGLESRARQHSAPMSLFPAYFGRKRPDDAPAPPPEPEDELRADVFNLIPPSATEKYERPKDAAPATVEPPAPEGRNVHTVNTMDLTRLSIDNDGRLYWDGKPVEVRRQLMMSRRQAIGAAVVAGFIVIAAVCSAIQAAATLSDWACRTGRSSDCVAAPHMTPTQRPSDIPV
jgi:hypothetical protein